MTQCDLHGNTRRALVQPFAVSTFARSARQPNYPMTRPRPLMKQKSLMGVAALLAALFLSQWLPDGESKRTGHAGQETPALTNALTDALTIAQSGEVVTIEAEIVRLLRDDNEGSRHQRFLVRTRSGQQILVAHNIDLAERLDGVTPGDPILIRGQFEWNEKGGVVHWTHHDPRDVHEAGWIRYRGRQYQ